MPALSSHLRKVLLADAVTSAGASLALIGGADLTHELLGLPSALLFWAGVAAVPFVILLAFVLRARRAPSWLIGAIIAMNIAWVAGSLFVAFGPAFAPSLFGQVFVVAQAAIVAVFAELQIIGLRRSAAMA